MLKNANFMFLENNEMGSSTFPRSPDFLEGQTAELDVVAFDGENFRCSGNRSFRFRPRRRRAIIDVVWNRAHDDVIGRRRGGWKNRC